MPIVGKSNDVYIEYTMPENIKDLITYDFLKEFRNQLFRIHEYYSLETFSDFGIPLNTSTAGWYAALGKTCLLTHKEEVFDYWRCLPWYDSDIFDGELAEMLIDKKLILGDSAEIIGKQLGINPDDIVYCCDCGRLYTKDMVVALTENDEDYCSDEGYTQYRCLHCQDTKNENGNTTNYYKDILVELGEYKKNHPINNEGLHLKTNFYEGIK